MLRTIFLGAILLLAPSTGAVAEIAFIPYKIENPSTEFPESTAGEYARILSVAALVAKESIEVSSPREIEIDLARMKRSPQELITGEDLDLLGRTRGIDRFLIGTLSRRGGRYRSESVLYSVREGKVTARIRVEGEDLVEIAEKEIREALTMFRNRSFTASRSEMKEMDLAVCIDMSYRINRDLGRVKEGIIALASRLIDTERLDTRIYIVPFSDRTGHSYASVSDNSITALKRELDKLKPAGAASPESFIASLRYAAGNIRWRREARKSMVIIANSPVAARGIDQYAAMARNRGVVIDTFSLGQIPGDLSEALERVALAGGGGHRHAAYHQRLFNAKGEPFDVFMENGRLFRSGEGSRGWRRGLYDTSAPRRHRGKPKEFMEEIIFDERRVAAGPYTIPESYAKITMERIVNQGELESNIEYLLGRAAGKVKQGRHAAASYAGKALISDGKVSFWVSVPDGEWMKFFDGRNGSGHFFLLGVTVMKDPSSPYGVTILPVTGSISADYLPRAVQADLGDIARRGEYYRTRGLWYPPVWFVKVRVEKAEARRDRDDVRAN